MTAYEVWKGSDGELTKAFYRELQVYGPLGEIAVALFRANKCSARAKVYRGGLRGRGSYKSMAYDRKNWSIGELCKALAKYAEPLQIEWGWKRDPNQEHHTWVIYADLADYGQVSFHSKDRGEGPDYKRDWDGKHLSTERICRLCDAVINGVTWVGLSTWPTERSEPTLEEQFTFALDSDT